MDAGSQVLSKRSMLLRSLDGSWARGKRKIPTRRCLHGLTECLSRSIHATWDPASSIRLAAQSSQNLTKKQIHRYAKWKIKPSKVMRPQCWQWRTTHSSMAGWSHAFGRQEMEGVGGTEVGSGGAYRNWETRGLVLCTGTCIPLLTLSTEYSNCATRILKRVSQQRCPVVIYAPLNCFCLCALLISNFIWRGAQWSHKHHGHPKIWGFCN